MGIQTSLGADAATPNPTTPDWKNPKFYTSHAIIFVVAIAIGWFAGVKWGKK